MHINIKYGLEKIKEVYDYKINIPSNNTEDIIEGLDELADWIKEKKKELKKKK